MSIPSSYKYDHIVATGGIGTGMFFRLNGNNTLGREESRLARLLPYKDYCKQHIILHYISVLLGRKFKSFAIGRVGDDDAGKNLLQQMEAAGIDVEHVKKDSAHATLFSVCYLYPDHSGGNITTDESASSHVTPADVDHFFKTFRNSGNELILAAPEVPVRTRIRLLEHGRARSSLNIASIASAEVEEFKSLNGFAMTDMLFINADEARMIAGLDDSALIDTIISNSIDNILPLNNNITVFITCGAAGAYAYYRGQLEFSKAEPADVVSTAGAGDAFLAGTVAGICCGLPILKDNKANTKTAVDAGLALAAASVTAPDTINTNISADFLSSVL